MEGTIYTSKEAILKRALEIIGIPLGTVDTTGRLATGKGAIGTLIEECWFGYNPNSESEPDFPEAGVELKVTPYLRSRSGIRAKERLVCNIINYMEEYDKTFETSAFWHKCKDLLLMSYEHRPNTQKSDFHIDAAILFSFPEEDLIIIERDWKTIIDKIRAGKAHEISEGDTLYLAACTKGATAASVRAQPFSSIAAKQRAYSLKASYMTQVLNRYIFGSEEDPHIIRDWRCLTERSFEEYVIGQVERFYGMTQEEMKRYFGIENEPKNLNELLLARMLNISARVSQTEEFKKASIVPKTIRVERDVSVRESMSFPCFDFIKLSEEEAWEESELYNYLAPTKFLFVVFQERADGQYVFERVMFWNIPVADLAQVEHVWERTVHIIRRGVVLRQTARGVANDLPKKAENPVAHVRPHGRDGNDKLQLPDGRWITRQCFWLNNTYIAEQVRKHR